MSRTTDSSTITASEAKMLLGSPQDGKYKCPVCLEWHLDVKQGKGKTLVKCWTPGCKKGAAWALIQAKLRGSEEEVTAITRAAEPPPETTELVEEAKAKRLKPSETPEFPGFKASDYCALKKFGESPLAWQFGLVHNPTGLAKDASITNDAAFRGKPCVAFPYFDTEGKLVGTKLRLSWDSHDTRWELPLGDPKVPYGLWLYDFNKVNDYDLFICEGESDTQTLYAHKFNAIGIPGNQAWRGEFKNLPCIKNAAKIFVMQDRKAGDQFVLKVSADLPKEKTYSLKLTDDDDPSAMHIRLVNEEQLREFPEAFLDQLKSNAAPHPDRFEDSDTGRAEMLVWKEGENIRYLTDEDCWAVWDGTVWAKRGNDNCILAKTKTVIRALIVDEGKRLAASSRGARSAMAALAQAEKEVWATFNDFDKKPMLLNVQNGTVDLETGAFREFQQADWMTKKAVVSFDPFAGCPLWEEFVEKIFLGDQDLIHFVQKALGYSLTGSIREQVFFICKGDGSNGKGTLLQMVQGLLGRDYYSAPMINTFLENKMEGPGYELADFAGVRLSVLAEPNKKKTLNMELIKLVTGNDIMKARGIFKRPIQFHPEFKLWILTNNDVKIEGSDHGTKRRPRVIPFDYKFEEGKDRDGRYNDPINSPLRAEWPGILNWLIDGCLAWQKEGLGTPQGVNSATEHLFDVNNAFKRFVDECAECGNPRYQTKGPVLTTSYRLWAERNGERDMTPQEITAELEQIPGLSRANKSSGYVWYGIQMRATERQSDLPAEGNA